MSVTATEISPADVPAAETGSVETVIRPKRGWIGVDWAELYKYRELLLFLVWRDVKVKYKQSIFGGAWAVVVPIVSVVIYTVVGIFAGFANKAGADGVPYAIYIYSGLLPWLFLQNAISGGGMSLVSNQALMSKIYLPRLFIPTAIVGSAIVDMFMSSIAFTLLCVFYHYKTGFVPSSHVFFVPLLLPLLWMAALGTAYLLSALTVMFRDLRFIIPFITQLGMWLTAVVYPQSIFGPYRSWLVLNPFAGIVQSFRAAITGEALQVPQLLSSIVLCSGLLVLGLFYFKRVERRFADIA